MKLKKELVASVMIVLLGVFLIFSGYGMKGQTVLGPKLHFRGEIGDGFYLVGSDQMPKPEFAVKANSTKLRNAVFGGLLGGATGTGVLVSVGGMGLVVLGTGIALPVIPIGIGIGCLAGAATGDSSVNTIPVNEPYVVTAPVPKYTGDRWGFRLGFGAGLLFAGGPLLFAALGRRRGTEVLAGSVERS